MATSDRTVSVSRTIDADPATIFAVLDDPAKHPLFDGSGTVKGAVGGTAGNSERHLVLGDTFGMNMRMGVPYRMKNTVVEYEKDRLIAWRHVGHHRWRYELEPVDGGTRVTETFDWGVARIPKYYELAGFPERHTKNMERTLERLDELVSGGR